MNPCKCAAAALIAILLLPGVAASADPAAEAYQKGLASYAQEDYDAAISAFTGALRLAPRDSLAYYGRGRAYGKKGDLDKAIADYTEAIRLDPKLAKAYNNRGVAYAKKGEHDKAIADYTEAIRLDPKYAEAYYNRGDAYRTQGRVRQGHRRLHRGHPARSEIRQGVSQPGRRLRGRRANTTRPSPTTPRPSGSIRKTPRPTTTGASPTARRASTTRPSPTTPRPSGSTRSTAEAYGQPGHRLPEKGRVRQGHRRLHRGHPAEPEVCRGLL